MKNRLKIRSLTENDANAVILLVKRVVSTCQTIILTPEEFAPTEEEERNFIQNYINYFGSVALGGFIDNQLVGCLFLERESRKRRSHTANLGISVHPSYRNMGIGTALIDEMIARVRTDGVLSRIELSVMANNSIAERLFRNAGFQIEGRRQGAFRVNNVDVDEILMGLKIEQE